MLSLRCLKNDFLSRSHGEGVMLPELYLEIPLFLLRMWQCPACRITRGKDIVSQKCSVSRPACTWEGAVAHSQHFQKQLMWCTLVWVTDTAQHGTLGGGASVKPTSQMRRLRLRRPEICLKPQSQQKEVGPWDSCYLTHRFCPPAPHTASREWRQLLFPGRMALIQDGISERKPETRTEHKSNWQVSCHC